MPACCAGSRASPTPTRHRGDAEVVVDTSLLSAEQAADRVLAHLQAEGYLSGAAAGG